MDLDPQPIGYWDNKFDNIPTRPYILHFLLPLTKTLTFFRSGLSLGRFPWFLPMASRCAGSLRRIIPLSPLRSFGVRSRPAFPSSSFAAGATAPRRFSSLLRLVACLLLLALGIVILFVGIFLLRRIPVELGSCVESLFPLHSAVAAARLTSRLSTTTHGGRSLSQGILCRTTPGL